VNQYNAYPTTTREKNDCHLGNDISPKTRVSNADTPADSSKRFAILVSRKTYTTCRYVLAARNTHAQITPYHFTLSLSSIKFQ